MQNPPVMNHICKYKLSQYHLQLFFSAVHSIGDSRANPSAAAQSCLQKILIHPKFKTAQRNCILLGDIPISNFTKNTNYVDNINKSLTTHRLVDELDEITQKESINKDDHCYLNDLCRLTKYVAEVIYYISKFVVKKIMKYLVCEHCLSALEGSKRNSLTSVKYISSLGLYSLAMLFILSVKYELKIAERFINYTPQQKFKYILMIK